MIGNLILQIEDILQCAVIFIGPEVRASLRLDQLRRNANAPAGLADAARYTLSMWLSPSPKVESSQKPLMIEAKAEPTGLKIDGLVTSVAEYLRAHDLNSAEIMCRKTVSA